MRRCAHAVLLYRSVVPADPSLPRTPVTHTSRTCCKSSAAVASTLPRPVPPLRVNQGARRVSGEDDGSGVARDGSHSSATSSNAPNVFSPLYVTYRNPSGDLCDS